MALGCTALAGIAAIFLNPPTIIVFLLAGLLPAAAVIILLLATGRLRALDVRDMFPAVPAVIFLSLVVGTVFYYSPGPLSSRLMSLREGLLPKRLLVIGQPLPPVSEAQSERIAQIQNSIETAEQLGVARSPDLYLESGLLNFSLKNFKAAEAQFRKATEFDPGGEWRQAVAVAYNNLGVILSLKGKVRSDNKILDESLSAFNSALKIASEKETMLTAELNRAQAQTFRMKGRYTEALAATDDILNTPDLPDYWRGLALRAKGVIADDQGKYEEALSYYEQAAKLHEAGMHWEELAIVRNNIGNVYVNRAKSAADADIDEAIRSHESALKLAQQAGSDEVTADSYNGLAYDYMKKNEFDKALGYAEQALEIYRKVKQRVGEAAILDTIGDIYQRKGRREEAVSFYTESLMIAREVGFRYGQAFTLKNLASVYIENKDCEHARPLLLESQGIFEQIEIPPAAEEVRKMYEKCAAGEKSEPSSTKGRPN